MRISQDGGARMRAEAIEPGTRARAVAAALGREPFDLLLTGGTVVDVGTGELRPADVGIVGPLVASVHPCGSRTDGVELHDVTGRFVAPGFIDTHVHFESSMLTPGRFTEAVLPRGTTTVFADPHELANAAGLDGVRYALDATRGLPLRFVFQAPSCVPPIPGLEVSAADFGAAEITEILAWPGTCGVGEVVEILSLSEHDRRLVEIVEAGIAHGEIVCGHALGLTGPDLQAYLDTGVTSDHEVFSADDVIERLRAGMTVELRGALDFFLPALVERLQDLPVIPTGLCTASDDVFAIELMDHGHIDRLLRLLVELGLDPVAALRLASHNGAYRLGRTDLGLVGPGRRADLVVLGDLARVTVDAVYTDGVLRARDGRMVEPAREGPATIPSRTVRVPRLTPEDLELRVDDVRDGEVTLRVVGGLGGLLAAWDEVTVEVRDGVAILPASHLVQAVVHRHGREAAVVRRGVVSGLGHWNGAMASSFAYCAHNLVVIGSNPLDMAAAANAVIDAGGGIAVASGGILKEILELPVAGLLSAEPPGDVAEAQRAIEDVARALGVEVTFLPHPIFAIVSCAASFIPGPRITDRGYIDGTTREVVGSMVADR